MKKSLNDAMQNLEDWSSSRFQEIEDAINDYVDGSIKEIENYRGQSLKRLENFKSGAERDIAHLINRMEKMQGAVEKVVAPREKWVEWEVGKVSRAAQKAPASFPAHRVPPEVEEPSTKVLQALSYTVFDTILFCITNGQSPDFALISQSVLFGCVYPNISRGYSSYLFRDVPPSGMAAIHQGKGILKELREIEPEYLDTPENWEKYAPQIQKWWINVALPLVFMDVDQDWATADLPSREDMMAWSDSDLTKLSTFPSIYDLTELAKEKSSEIAARYSFKPYMEIA